MIRIEMLTVGMFQSNCYIVVCDETSRALVVDAGDEADRILARVRELGITVEAIVNTHTHIDHVAALPEVKDALSVPVWMHRDDLPVYEGLEGQAAMFGLTAPKRVEIDRFLEDGETVRVGNLEAGVVLAPGHSPGSICLMFGGCEPPRVFSGDVLFMGSIGRTDLPGGSHETIMETLKSRFLPMPDDTLVYPGHGPSTSMGREKASNPFLAPLTWNS